MKVYLSYSDSFKVQEKVCQASNNVKPSLSDSLGRLGQRNDHTHDSYFCVRSCSSLAHEPTDSFPRESSPATPAAPLLSSGLPERPWSSLRSYQTVLYLLLFLVSSQWKYFYLCNSISTTMSVEYILDKGFAWKYRWQVDLILHINLHQLKMAT